MIVSGSPCFLGSGKIRARARWFENKLRKAKEQINKLSNLEVVYRDHRFARTSP
jgi:hypothetical protein